MTTHPLYTARWNLNVHEWPVFRSHPASNSQCRESYEGYDKAMYAVTMHGETLCVSSSYKEVYEVFSCIYDLNSGRVDT